MMLAGSTHRFYLIAARRNTLPPLMMVEAMKLKYLKEIMQYLNLLTG